MSSKEEASKKKVPMWLLPQGPLVLLAKVLESGGEKYGYYDWRLKKVSEMEYMSAIHRHYSAALDGEYTDPESGLPHVAHIMGNCAVLIDAGIAGTLEHDGPPGGSAGDLIRAFRKKEA